MNISHHSTPFTSGALSPSKVIPSSVLRSKMSPLSTPQVPQQVIATKARTFVQDLQRISGVSYKTIAPLQALLIQYQSIESPALKAALYKKDSYFTRFFGEESWHDWVEDRTVIGKVVLAFDEYLKSNTRLELHTSSLSKSEIKEACSEAEGLLVNSENDEGSHESISRRLSQSITPSWFSRYDTPGTAYGVYGIGTTVYVADYDRGLQIIDVSNPKAPFLLGTYDTTGSAFNVIVVGSIAYVADYSSGLQIIDVGTPSTPTLLGTYNTPGSAYDVAVVGTTAYVADGPSGLQILNVGTPSSPKLIGTYDTPGDSRGIYVSGTIAYIADLNTGLQIINVTTPSTPTLLGTYATSTNAYDVIIVGKIAYATCSKSFNMINISTPSSPTLLSTYVHGGSNAITNSLYISGNTAYMTDQALGLIIIDISTPSSPVRLGGYDSPGTPRGVYRVGNLIYLAKGSNGLEVFGFSDFTSLGQHQTNGQANKIALQYPLAYIPDGYAGLKIVDISTPQTPVQLSVYDTPSAAMSVFTIPGVAYVANNRFGLHIVDISNPAHPKMLGLFTCPGDTENVVVAHNLAYIAGGNMGVWIVNVTNPASPHLVGGYETVGESLEVVVIGNLAYVADGSAGLQILNITLPDNPQKVSRYDTTGTAYSVVVNGTYAYIADGAAIQVINIANLNNPTSLSSYTTSFTIGLTLDGNLLYASDYNKGVYIFNVQIPSSPTLIALYEHPNTRGTLIYGNIAYMSQDTDGLELVQLAYKSPVTESPTLSPTTFPTVFPTFQQTNTPSSIPTQLPTSNPSTQPTLAPTPYDLEGFVHRGFASESSIRLSNVTYIMSRLVTEANLRTTANTALIQQIDEEKQERLFNISFVFTQMILESQFRKSNDTEILHLLDAEAQSRQSQDSGLRAQIREETMQRIANISFIIAELALEFVQRHGNDTWLLMLIMNETQTRETDTLVLHKEVQHEEEFRLANVSYIMSRLATEANLRTTATNGLIQQIDVEKQERLFNVSFVFTQMILESQFRQNNDTQLLSLILNETQERKHFNDQLVFELNTTRDDFNQNIANRMAESLQNANATAVILNALGNTLQIQIDTEKHTRISKDAELLTQLVNVSLLASHLAIELIELNGNVTLFFTLLTNETTARTSDVLALRHELNTTRKDFNRNIADRMAESLQNADTTASVLNAMGNTLQNQINSEKESRIVLENLFWRSLSNETALRLANISTIMIQLNFEISQRKQANTEVQARINNETQERKTAIAHLATQLNTTRLEFQQNIATRMAETLENSDAATQILTIMGNTLQTQLDTEKALRITNDTELWTAITTENINRLANFSYAISQLILEAQTRESHDKTLFGNLTQETSERIAAISILSAQMAIEFGLRTGNDTVLFSLITTLGQDLNNTRRDFNENIAHRMADTLKSANTTAAVLESMGSTLETQITTEKISRIDGDNRLKSDIQTEKDHLIRQFYELGNVTYQFIFELNQSLSKISENSTTSFGNLQQLIQTFSSETAQRFIKVSDELAGDIFHANKTLYEYFLSVKHDLQTQSTAFGQKIDQQGQQFQELIESFGLNNTDARELKIPSKYITNLITKQSSSIEALDDPIIQEMRRMFDLILSCKEAIMIFIFFFNALVLVQGMSVIQSLHYSFALQDKSKLDTLRRGKAGSVGPKFDDFVTHLEKILVEGAFTTKERLERLHKLADIQRMKHDSLQLFASMHSLDELQQSMKDIQELCVVGILREGDLSRKYHAQTLYNAYEKWRRTNSIRTLIYTVLRPYTGSIDHDENKI